MEPANEILESASHDRPLVAQTYSAAVTKGTYVPSSPTRHGKEKAGKWGREHLCVLLHSRRPCELVYFSPGLFITSGVTWSIGEQ